MRPDLGLQREPANSIVLSPKSTGNRRIAVLINPLNLCPPIFHVQKKGTGALPPKDIDVLAITWRLEHSWI